MSDVLHTPPVAGSVKVVVAPAHTKADPVIGEGNGLTVTGVVVIHPVPSEKVMVATPAATPVTIPVAEPIVAVPVLPLVHNPPPPASLSVVVAPIHTWVRPVIAGGSVFTVTTRVTLHPVGKV